MDINHLIGIAAIGYGAFTLYAHITKNNKFFWKIEPMKKFWGEKVGTAIHFVSYVIVPLVIGVYIVFFDGKIL